MPTYPWVSEPGTADYLAAELVTLAFDYARSVGPEDDGKKSLRRAVLALAAHDRAVEPCGDCLRLVYRPAADAVLATVRRALVLQQNGGLVAGDSACKGKS